MINAVQAEHVRLTHLKWKFKINLVATIKSMLKGVVYLKNNKVPKNSKVDKGAEFYMSKFELLWRWIMLLYFLLTVTWNRSEGYKL